MLDAADLPAQASRAFKSIRGLRKLAIVEVPSTIPLANLPQTFVVGADKRCDVSLPGSGCPTFAVSVTCLPTGTHVSAVDVAACFF